MKRTFAKLTAMLLALMLLLTGCNLIDVDQVALIEQEREELEEQYSVVLAEYDGGTVTEFDALASFYSNYSYLYQLYSYFSMSITEDMIDELVQEAVEAEVENAAISLQFESRGLTLDVTDEEILEESEESYQESYEYYIDEADGDTDEEKAANAELSLYSQGFTVDRLYEMNLASYKAEAVQEDTEAEITEVTDDEMQEAYEEELAADEETYTDTPTQFESDATDSDEIICWRPEGYRAVKHVLVIPEDDVLDAVTDARDAVDTAEEELETLLEEMDEATDDDADEETEDAETDESAEDADDAEDEETDESAEDADDAEDEEAAEETEESEETEEADEEEDTAEDETEDDTEEEAEDDSEDEEDDESTRSVEEIQADIDAKYAEIDELQAVADAAEEACIASVQDTIDEIYAALDAGEDIDTVMEEYGEDPGMQSDPSMTTGYYVCADSTNWDEYFSAGAMALQSVGDYSDTPVISSSGIHIIYYYADVESGAVPLEEVYDALYEQTLETLKSEHYESELESWVEALNPVYYLDNWDLT